MSPPSPYRQLPWSEVDLLLHPGRFLTRREAMEEIDRIRALLDERKYPKDAALLSRTATALDKKGTDIDRWARPTQRLISVVGGGLLSAALTTFIRGHFDRGSVAMAALCFAMAFLSALVTQVWPAAWLEVAVAYGKLSVEMRRLSDKVADTGVEKVAEPPTGVRVDPGAPRTEDEHTQSAEVRARKASE